HETNPSRCADRTQDRSRNGFSRTFDDPADPLGEPARVTQVWLLRAPRWRAWRRVLGAMPTSSWACASALAVPDMPTKTRAWHPKTSSGPALGQAPPGSRQEPTGIEPRAR